MNARDTMLYTLWQEPLTVDEEFDLTNKIPNVRLIELGLQSIEGLRTELGNEITDENGRPNYPRKWQASKYARGIRKHLTQ